MGVVHCFNLIKLHSPKHKSLSGLDSANIWDACNIFTRLLAKPQYVIRGVDPSSMFIKLIVDLINILSIMLDTESMS